MWRALTDPEELAAWWGEGTTLKAGPGGSGRFVEDDEPTRLGTVVEVRPGQRLVFDWWPEDPDEDEPASRVTVDLEPCPFGTVVTITQRTLLDMSLLPVLVLPRPTFLPGEDQPGLGLGLGRWLAREPPGSPRLGPSRARRCGIRSRRGRRARPRSAR